MAEYTAFLLKVWRETGDSSLRIALENIHSGERIGFNSFEEFMTYLQETNSGLSTPQKALDS